MEFVLPGPIRRNFSPPEPPEVYNYLYTVNSFNLTQGRIYKYSPNSMTSLGYYTHGGGVGSFIYYKDLAYCGGREWSFTVRQVNPTTLTLIRQSPSYNGMVVTLAHDDNNLYCQGYTTQKVWKLNVSNMSKIQESQNYGGPIRSIVCDNKGYIFCSGEITNKIWKINTSTMVKENESQLFHNKIFTSAYDGQYIYCQGEQPGILWKVNANTMETIQENTISQLPVYYMHYRTGFLYLGTYDNKVFKVDINTLEIVQESADFGQTVTSITSDYDYIYIGGSWSGHKLLWKLRQSDLVKVQQSSVQVNGTILGSDMGEF